jgi:hypothetical protein
MKPAPPVTNNIDAVPRPARADPTFASARRPAQPNAVDAVNAADPPTAKLDSSGLARYAIVSICNFEQKRPTHGLIESNE